MIVIMEFINRLIKNKKIEITDNEKKMIDFTTKICIVFILFIPILPYTTMVMRLPRAIILFIYLAIGTVIADKIISRRKLEKNSIVLVVLLIMLVFVWIQGFIVSIDNTDRTYGALLGNNYLIDIFIK